MRRLIHSTVLTAVLALTAVPAFPAPYDQKPGHGKKSFDPFLNGEPFHSRSGALAAQARRHPDASPQRGHRKPGHRISRCLPTLFRSSSRPELAMTFWIVIKSKAKPAAAVPLTAKPVAKGMLNLTCAPVECQVKLNGTALGPTAAAEAGRCRADAGQLGDRFCKRRLRVAPKHRGG